MEIYKNDQDICICIKSDKLCPLLIIFSGIGGGLCMPIYEFKNFLTANFDCHMIFIKDRSKSWYFKGIHGFSISVDDTVNKLTDIIKNIRYSTIITIGGSMGGYASILYGKLLHVDHIVSFCPQTFIDHKNRSKYNDNRWKDSIDSLHNYDMNNKYYDLALLGLSDIEEIIVIYGDDDIMDKHHANRITGKNIKVTEYKGSHNVMKVMRDNGDLFYLIKNIIDGSSYNYS